MSGFMGLYGYPIAGYGTAYMPDDSDKALKSDALSGLRGDALSGLHAR